MQTENWEKVKEILEEVLQLDVSERQKFLDKSGVRPEVRAEVESLLAYEVESENMMRLSAVEFSRDFLDAEDNDNALIGQQIGVYRIISELGYGGMGAVYLAERTDGQFEQQVALKLLKRELNTAELRRRFRHEREILASLQHPNIARLLDAGTTEDKIPFLAMEYVEGLPIDQYCSKHNLNLNVRLDLFRTVCRAVDFAHRNLIVHRDLKPSNILVTTDGTPKLLDFGISKILSPERDQINSATVTRLGVMTPFYASPEQLQRESVTTATDIYSLGVILYELLSGCRPFEEREADVKEIYKAVLETDPVPPSLMLEASQKSFRINTTSATGIKPESSARGSQKNGSETGQNRLRLTRPHTSLLSAGSIRGDLDNIVLKALRKEPERRYSSAENLAEDIRRHQNGLPVTARPNTLAYRTGKFIKRNRASAAAGLLLVLAIAAGIFATLWQAQVARAERARAEKRFGDVRKLANSYLFDIFPEIEDLEGSLKARELILKTALEYLDSLSKEAEGDQELQLELATAYEKIGEVQGAVNIPNLGDINAGLQSYQKAQALREAVFSANPGEPKNKEALSRNYQVTAQTLMWNIDTARAAQYFEKAIALRRQLVAEKPESPDLQNRLAVLLTDYASIAIADVENEKARALIDESEKILRQVLEKNPDHFYTRKAYPRILRARGRLKINTGDYAGAIADIGESVRLTGDLIQEKPEDYSLRRTAFLNDFHYCEIYLAMRDGQKAVDACTETIEFNKRALEKEPDESFALYDLAISNYCIAQGYRMLNNPHRSIKFAEKALVSLSKLNSLSPGINEYERGVAVVENEIAASLLLIGKSEEALKYLESARVKMEKVVQTDQTVTSYRLELAKVYRTRAQAFDKKGEKTNALENVNQAIALVARLKERNNLKDGDKNLLEELEREKARYEV